MLLTEQNYNHQIETYVKRMTNAVAHPTPRLRAQLNEHLQYILDNFYFVGSPFIVALNFKAGHAQWNRYQVDNTGDIGRIPTISEIITWYRQYVLHSADAVTIVNFELTTNLLDIPVFAIRHNRRNTYHIFKLSIIGDLPLTNCDQIDPTLVGTYTFHQANQFALFLRQQCNCRKLSGEQRLQMVNKFVMSGAEPRIGQLFN